MLFTHVITLIFEDSGRYTEFVTKINYQEELFRSGFAIVDNWHDLFENL
jgi:hypothetical protein